MREGAEVRALYRKKASHQAPSAEDDSRGPVQLMQVELVTTSTDGEVRTRCWPCSGSLVLCEMYRHVTMCVN